MTVTFTLTDLLSLALGVFLLGFAAGRWPVG